MDLKDAYFHIQIAPHHGRFLRFAFKGTMCRFTVMPFGQALAPRTLTKFADVALSPLRASGLCIFNYLDEWLVLAHSEDVLNSNKHALLLHLESLGLCANKQKSVLCPSQSIIYLWDLEESASEL